jgi:hypothetical protein
MVVFPVGGHLVKVDSSVNLLAQEELLVTR